MNRTQLENLYVINGLHDFRLRTPDDLLRTQGIRMESTDGYQTLTDQDKIIFERFIINFFNCNGMDRRAAIFPFRINQVEEIHYLVREYPDEEYDTVAGIKITIITKDGTKVCHSDNLFEGYDHLEKTMSKPEQYLRFEFTEGTTADGEPRHTWLHVTKQGTEWY